MGEMKETYRLDVKGSAASNESLEPIDTIIQRITSDWRADGYSEITQ